MHKVGCGLYSHLSCCSNKCPHPTLPHTHTHTPSLFDARRRINDPTKHRITSLGKHATLSGRPVSSEAEELRVEEVVVVVAGGGGAVVVVQGRRGAYRSEGMMSPQPEPQQLPRTTFRGSQSRSASFLLAEVGLPPSIHRAGCNTFRWLIYIQINTARRNNVRLKGERAALSSRQGRLILDD